VTEVCCLFTCDAGLFRGTWRLQPQIKRVLKHLSTLKTEALL